MIQMKMPMAEAIVSRFVEKCNLVNPDGSTSEDIDLDLLGPITELERALIVAEQALADANLQSAGRELRINGLAKSEKEAREQIAALIYKLAGYADTGADGTMFCGKCGKAI